MTNQAIAHIRKEDKKEQLLIEHLEETSEMAGHFAEKIGLKESGEILGIFHDLGKASQEFQDYLRSATGLIAPDEDNYIDTSEMKGKIDHSTAGAQFLYKYYKNKEPFAAQILPLCIASHHSGLIDCLSPDGINVFMNRIKKSEDKTFFDEGLAYLSDEGKKLFNDKLSPDIEKNIRSKLDNIKEKNDSKETFTFKCGLLIRYLFSCLIDADRLSTANFENPKDEQLRNIRYHPWNSLVQRMEKKVEEFEKKPNKRLVDEIRNQVSEACLNFAQKPKGIYQLTVPTGGGKTLASLRFALHHAKIHNMERIFYIIPYTSIIDQNADEARKILEDRDENGKYLDRVILEHHSNLTPENETYRQNLLSQNWDAPIVFTTQVQFFEALFGSGTRGARRMHQLANSVIIFDEVQTIPVRCVHMFNLSLRFLTHDCGSTIVLCTATQPLLDKVEPAQRSLTIAPEQHIISDEKALAEKLKRVQTIDRRKAGGWNEDEVANLIKQESEKNNSILVIVNTRKSALSLYKKISSLDIAKTFHLSTNMCPSHRLSVLAEIKMRLKEYLPVICISTQLIEAGIDIDFGMVIRYLAGLDSIAQAAGRCNRNGERGIGRVFIINSENENLDKLSDIQDGANNTQRILDEIKNKPDIDIISIENMERYYQYYFYQKKDDMCYPVKKDSPVGREDNLFNILSVNQLSVDEYRRINGNNPSIVFNQSFQTAAYAFRAIDTSTIGVIVPYKSEGKEIIISLCSSDEIEKEYKLLKKAQRYSINLYKSEFNEMVNKQAVHEVQKNSGIYYLDDQYYSDQFGWSNKIVNDMEILID